MDPENKEEETKDEVVDAGAEGAGDEGQEGKKDEQVADDRPERNWKAEIERKNREIERLRQITESQKHNQRRDPNDLATWTDHELKAVIRSDDPSMLSFKDQAEEVLFERKVQNIRERERAQEKRALADIELRSKYPDALDPSSELSLKIDQVMYELDLQKSPAGRLAAAKIAAAELGKGSSKSKALARKQEEERIARVKGQVVDGDRAKPAETPNDPKKLDELVQKINARDPNASTDAFGQLLKMRGLSQEDFFKK